MTPEEWERFRTFHVTTERAKLVGSLVLLFVVYMAAVMWLLFG